MLLRVPWNPCTSFSTIGVPSWYVDASSAGMKSTASLDTAGNPSSTYWKASWSKSSLAIGISWDSWVSDVFDRLPDASHPPRARPKLFRNACSSCRPNCRDSWFHSPRKQRCGNAGAIAAGFLVHAEEPIPGLCPPEATDSDCATDLATFSQYVATGFCRVLGFQHLQRREPEHLRVFFHGRLHGCKV